MLFMLWLWLFSVVSAFPSHLVELNQLIDDRVQAHFDGSHTPLTFALFTCDKSGHFLAYSVHHPLSSSASARFLVEWPEDKKHIQRLHQRMAQFALQNANGIVIINQLLLVDESGEISQEAQVQLNMWLPLWDKKCTIQTADHVTVDCSGLVFIVIIHTPSLPDPIASAITSNPRDWKKELQQLFTYHDSFNQHAFLRRIIFGEVVPEGEINEPFPNYVAPSQLSPLHLLLILLFLLFVVPTYFLCPQFFALKPKQNAAAIEQQLNEQMMEERERERETEEKKRRKRQQSTTTPVTPRRNPRRKSTSSLR